MSQNHSERQSQTNPSTPVLAEVLHNAAEQGQGSAGKDDRKEVANQSVLWKVFGSTILGISATVAVMAYQSLSQHLAEIRSDTSALKEDRKGLLALEDRCAVLSQMQKDSEEDRRKLASELQLLREQRAQSEERRALAAELAMLRERLATLEGKQDAPKSPDPSPAPKVGRLSGLFGSFGKLILGTCVPTAYSSDPNKRMTELLNKSEDLRQIEQEWQRFWFTDQPSHVTYERVHGGLQ